MNSPNTITSAEQTAVEPSSAFIKFILGQLDCARLRALIEANEIATTATALSAGLISIEAAVAHLMTIEESSR
jgi:hypothetical protein